MGKAILLLMFMGLLSRCYDKPDPQAEAKFQPEVNLNPQHFMTVKGKVDPKIAKETEIKWIVTYFTNNYECFKTINPVEGVKAERSKNIIFSILPSNNGNFELKLPLDQFKAGFCEWKASYLDYQVFYRHELVKSIKYTGFIISTEQRSKSKASISWACILSNTDNINCSSSSINQFNKSNRYYYYNQNGQYFMSIKLEQ